jgi:hypothetical protein
MYTPTQGIPEGLRGPTVSITAAGVVNVGTVVVQ